MKSPEFIQSFDPWRETPRSSVIIVLVSVFLFFTTIGFANDIIALGSKPSVSYVLGIILPAAFAVLYAVAGIHLRRNWWKGALLIFAVEFLTMWAVGHWFPDLPGVVSMNWAELGRVRARLTFDSIATMTAVSLGYTGFFYVSVREARRYVKTRTEKALLESEMAAARQVQRVILPDPHQSFPGFAVDSVYKPAREVGGDFFQIVALPDGGLLLVIGDVAGKGLPAAMLVALLIGSIRAIAEDTRDPVMLLGKLNDTLIGRAPDGFATALAALIASNGLVTFANAGHLSPYLDGQEIELPGALPLGIRGGGRYEATRMELQPGRRLTFLSDGVVEAQNERRELFGFDRAKAMSREAAATVADAAVQFGQDDDITVVTIERRANT